MEDFEAHRVLSSPSEKKVLEGNEVFHEKETSSKSDSQCEANMNCKALCSDTKFNKYRETTIDVRSLPYGPQVSPSQFSLNERYALCLSIAAECIQKEELMELLMREPNPVCYDGFEPSGRIHIAQGAAKVISYMMFPS